MSTGHVNQYTDYGRDSNRTAATVRRIPRANPHYLSTLKERIAARFFVGPHDPDILETCGLGDDTFPPEILARLRELESDTERGLEVP